MLQVPFGEVAIVKEWLHICGPVYKPNPEHPKRPIWGYDCARSEVFQNRTINFSLDCVSLFALCNFENDLMPTLGVVEINMCSNLSCTLHLVT